MKDSVFVKGLEFEANHGYTAAERRSTRRFRLNLELSASLDKASRSDHLKDTLDYWTICKVAQEVGTKSTFKLLEALAGAIINKLQETYPNSDIAIELEKLAAPCPGVPESCGVKMFRPSGS